MGMGPPHIAVKGQTGLFGGSLGDGQGNAENGVGPEPSLVLGAVEFNHRAINQPLVVGLKAAQGIEDFTLGAIDSLLHPLAAEARRIVVAQLNRLKAAGRGTRGHSGATHGTGFKLNIHLNGGHAPGVEDFAGGDINNRTHGIAFFL